MTLSTSKTVLWGKWKSELLFASSTELPLTFQMASLSHCVPVYLWKAPILKFLPLLHSSFLLAFVCACLACLHACVCRGRWISALEDGKYSNLNGRKLAVSGTIGTLGKMRYGGPCSLQLFCHSSQEVSISCTIIHLPTHFTACRLPRCSS